MKALLREPLVYFVLLTALLFAGSALTSKASRPDALVVTKGRIASLATDFERTWQRAPSDTEIQGLIDEYVRDEVSVREAAALGLDRDDTVTRRRLRQKLELIAQDKVAEIEPTEEQLRRYFESHVDDYRTESGSPPFASVRDRVRVDWADAERRAASEAYYHALLARYTIVVSTEE